jgi:hypothetical protein
MTQTRSVQSLPASLSEAASTLAKFATVGSPHRRFGFRFNRSILAVAGYIFAVIDNKWLQAYTHGVA